MKKLFLMLFSLILALALFANFTPASAKKDQIKLKVFEHFPKNPGQPLAVSNCTPTTNDRVNDYGWAGWIMPSAGMTYKINFQTLPRNLDPSLTQIAIDNSFDTWTDADPNQIFNYGGTTNVKTNKYDGTNAILFKSSRSGAIATTYVWYYVSSRQLVEADTVFNKSYKWSVSDPNSGDCAGPTDSYDVQNIGTHEFGHWIGLDDLYNSNVKDLTMYGYGELGELKKNSLGQGDLTGVLSINP